MSTPRPTPRRALLDEIGWSVRELARRCDWTENMARRWVMGERVYPALDSWLGTVAAAMREHPRTLREAQEA